MEDWRVMSEAAEDDDAMTRDDAIEFGETFRIRVRVFVFGGLTD